MACDPNTLLSSAAAFQGLSERDQMICIAELLCEFSTGGAGMQAGDYGGGQPTWTPVGTMGMAVDTSNSRVWIYYSGTWN